MTTSHSDLWLSERVRGIPGYQGWTWRQFTRPALPGEPPSRDGARARILRDIIQRIETRHEDHEQLEQYRAALRIIEQNEERERRILAQMGESDEAF